MYHTSPIYPTNPIQIKSMSSITRTCLSPSPSTRLPTTPPKRSIRRRQLNRHRLLPFLLPLRRRQTRPRIIMLNNIHRPHRPRRTPFPPLIPRPRHPRAPNARRIRRRRTRVKARRRTAQRSERLKIIRVRHRMRVHRQRRIRHHKRLGLIILRQLIPPHRSFSSAGPTIHMRRLIPIFVLRVHQIDWTFFESSLLF